MSSKPDPNALLTSVTVLLVVGMLVGTATYNNRANLIARCSAEAESVANAAIARARGQ